MENYGTGIPTVNYSKCPVKDTVKHLTCIYLFIIYLFTVIVDENTHEVQCVFLALHLKPMGIKTSASDAHVEWRYNGLQRPR